LQPGEYGSAVSELPAGSICSGRRVPDRSDDWFARLPEPSDPVIQRSRLASRPSAGRGAGRLYQPRKRRRTMIDLLIQLLIFLVVVGVVMGLLLWALEQFPNFPPQIKAAIRVLIVVIVVLIVLVFAVRILQHLPALGHLP
jgi:hypothetical protein